MCMQHLPSILFVSPDTKPLCKVYRFVTNHVASTCHVRPAPGSESDLVQVNGVDVIQHQDAPAQTPRRSC